MESRDLSLKHHAELAKLFESVPGRALDGSLEDLVAGLQESLTAYRTGRSTDGPGGPVDAATHSALERFGAAASGLAGAIASLGDEARARLAGAGQFGPAELGRLAAIASEAEAAALRSVQPAPRASDRAEPADRLVHTLFEVWEAQTGTAPGRDPAGRSAFARFVRLSCALVEIGADEAHARRLRVHEVRELSESAGLLEMIPDE